jgi:hypothetical protein
MTCPHRHHVIICAVLLSGVAALPPLIKIGEFAISVHVATDVFEQFQYN